MVPAAGLLDSTHGAPTSPALAPMSATRAPRELRLRTKLLLMMLSLLLLSLSSLFLLHLYSEQGLLAQVRAYTEELSTAIEIAPGEGQTRAHRLQPTHSTSSTTGNFLLSNEKH